MAMSVKRLFRVWIDIGGTLTDIVAMGPEGWEPLFALWPVAALSHVEARLFAGERAVHRVLAGLGAKALHLPDTSPPWTLNLNAPDDLARARSLAVPTP